MKSFIDNASNKGFLSMPIAVFLLVAVINTGSLLVKQALLVQIATLLQP